MRYFKRLILTFILSALLFFCTNTINPIFALSIFILQTISKSDLGGISQISELLNAETKIVIIILFLTFLISTIILMLMQRILILCINSYKIKEKQD